MRVLALDPGEKVGWAVGNVDLDHLTPVFPEMPEWRSDSEPMPQVTIETMPVLTVENHGISHMRDMALAVHKQAGKYDVIIYETWKLSAAHAKKLVGNDMQSSQFIGMVRLAAWLNPSVRLVPQPPKDKATADKVMPRLYPEIQRLIDNAPKAHDESHDTDALRHLAKWHWDTYVGNSTNGAR